MLQPKFTPPSDGKVNNDTNAGFTPPSDGVVKKKEESVSNAPIQGSASEQKVGSLDGKATKGFPKVDTNSVAPGMGDQPRAETAISPIKKQDLFKKSKPLDTTSLGGASMAPEKFNFAEQGISEDEIVKRELIAKKKANDLSTKQSIADGRATVKPTTTGRYDSLASGVYNAFESMLEVVPLAYDTMAAYATNPIIEALGGEKTSSEKFAKEWHLDNFVPEFYTKRKAELQNSVQKFNEERGGDIIGAVEEGRIIDAVDMITSSSLQSLPQMAVAFGFGGGKTALTAIGLTTAASRNAELKGSNPEMELHTRVLNAGVSGYIEANLGHVMSGASGAAVKKILAKEGVEATSKIMSKSFRKTMAKFVGDNPVVGMVGEVTEETFTSVLNQLNDIATGVRTESVDFRQAANEGISSLGLGVVNTTTVYGAKAFVKSVDYRQAKKTNKEISRLSSELTNDDLSDANKEILKAKIQRLSVDNKKLIGDGIDKVNALPINVKEELSTIDSSIGSLKVQIVAIQDDSSINDNTKQALIAEIKEQGKELIARKNKVIDGNYIYDDFKKLPQKEKNKFKDEAGRLLLAEAKKGGKENASFEDAELSKKAAELHNESLKQEAKAQIEAEQKSVVDAPSEVITPTQEVEDLRAQEQVELQDAIPNIDDYKVDGKVDESKITDVQDKQEFDEIYDKYDKLITPLLEQQNEATPPSNSVFDDVSLSNDIGIDRNSIPLDGKSESIDLGVIVATNGDKLSISAEEINLSYPGKKKFVRKITAENTVDGSKAILSFSIDNGKLIIKHVESDKKGSGYGTDLINKAIDEAKKQGITEVVADDVESLQSEEYWNKIGFKQDPDSRSNRILDISETNEATPPTDTPANGNVQLGTPIVEQNGKQQGSDAEVLSKPSDLGKSKGDVEVAKKPVTLQEDAKSDIDYSLEQIDKGVLQWNGNIDSPRVDIGMSWADIRKGEADLKRGKPNTVPAKRLIEALKKAKEEGGYRYKQGTGGEKMRSAEFVTFEQMQKATNENELTDSEQKELDQYEEKLAKEHNDYIDLLDDESITEIYGNQENNTGNEGVVEKPTAEGASKKNADNQKKPTKPARKTAAERIKINNANIDDIKNTINSMDSIFGFKIKAEDIDGLNSNGIDIVNVIAGIVKQAMAAGIQIDEAISKTIEHLKKTLDFEVNIDDIKAKLNPKINQQAGDFKASPGKKSLLNRLIEGGNGKDVTEALEKLGEEYDVRNQQEVDDLANAFIDKVGIGEALKAAMDGTIKNNDTKYMVYAEALERLKNQIDDKANVNDREALIAKFQEISNTFDLDARNAGQGLAILNHIYNKNQALKYSLSKVINDYKQKDPNGEIPAEIQAQFEALEKKLKDVEERTKEAEKRAKKAEDDLAVKNIQEDLARKKQQNGKNKSGLTPNEVKRKKELKNKFFGRLNDATGLVAMLADPEFREYLGLTFKAAKGDFKNFSTQVLKELGNGAKKHLPKLFTEAQVSSNTNTTNTSKSIKITEDGSIKIPAQMLRDYVEAGETDIDVIAGLIKEDIAEEYPDVDIRDIRDALTGYGKQINPNKDVITAEVNKLKEYGRLLSAYEDVLNGKMPQKSGLKRAKPEQKARELRKEINRLAKELKLEAIDLDTQWATAIDKVKSNLKNQIEDLDKQIANGEKRKVERNTIELDQEAKDLTVIRDVKRKLLDNMVGKPELTEEQKIARAEKSLQTSIDKLNKDIASGEIDFKEKPTAVTSAKIQSLKEQKKSLLDTRKQLREETGLIDKQKLKSAKTRVKNQIEDLNNRIKNRDFAIKEVKPILADNELNSLRAEKEAVYEEYEKLKYTQELLNRSTAKKWTDAIMEGFGITRAIKASLDLGLIGIQLRGFTYSELWRSPAELGRKMSKLFGAIGSQEKTNKAMSTLVGHPLHALAKKLDIGITHPDLRNEVREELASGNLLHQFWALPIVAMNVIGKQNLTQAKRKSLGDTFIDGFKKQYNKIFKNSQLVITEKSKYSRAEQWRNLNAFEAIERGLSTFGNQLRFEEFIRGVERLKAEGKDEINHLEDYKALASYIRTFSGRAKPAGFEMNQKALNVFFFSFKNAASIVQQLNPIYYGLQHVNSTDFKNGNYTKIPVANKMAMATMLKSVTSSLATMAFIAAGYAAFKDDDDEELTVETNPNSSDFMKIKIGNLRYDPWGGYVPLITLYSRLLTEEVKKADGTVYKMGEQRFGISSRVDAASRFLINKESPGFQMFHHYMASTEQIDPITGETSRVNNFGQTLSEDEAFSMYPIFLGSVKQAIKEDKEGVQSFLTAYSVFGLGNVQKYESAKGATLEEQALDVFAKRKIKSELPLEEKIKGKVDNRITRAESKIKEREYQKIAQKLKVPYYTPGGVKVDVSKRDFTTSDAGIENAKNKIEEVKSKYGIVDKK